jgi:DNA-binding MarR family transcriptional regulator
MERTTLSRNLKPLPKQPYIGIAASNTDSRVNQIAITATGRAKFKQALKRWRRGQQRVNAAYDERSRRTLEKTLRELRLIDT